MYVVVVNFDIKPSHWQEFLPAMKENARLSLEQEPGCRQFDICTSPNKPHSVFLYEVYDSEEAFKAHLASEHFVQFNALTSAWLAGKQVETFTRIQPASQA